MGHTIKLVRFADYWQKGMPKLAGITYKVFAEVTTGLNALTTGQINYVYSIPADQLAVLKKASNVTAQVSQALHSS